MIDYKHGVWGMGVLVRLRGSVIPKALAPRRAPRPTAEGTAPGCSTARGDADPGKSEAGRSEGFGAVRLGQIEKAYSGRTVGPRVEGTSELGDLAPWGVAEPRLGRHW